MGPVCTLDIDVNSVTNLVLSELLVAFVSPIAGSSFETFLDIMKHQTVDCDVHLDNQCYTLFLLMQAFAIFKVFTTMYNAHGLLL